MVTRGVTDDAPLPGLVVPTEDAAGPTGYRGAACWPPVAELAAELVVDVIGTPAPQGSKKHVGRGILVEMSKLVTPWRQDVAAAATAEMLKVSWVCLDGPCVVRIDFYLRRPVSAPKRRVWPDRQPDVDKLARSSLDALSTAGVFADDARVVDLHVVKHFAVAGLPTGARIVVRPVRPGDAP